MNAQCVGDLDPDFIRCDHPDGMGFKAQPVCIGRKPAQIIGHTGIGVLKVGNGSFKPFPIGIQFRAFRRADRSPSRMERNQ